MITVILTLIGLVLLVLLGIYFYNTVLMEKKFFSVLTTSLMISILFLFILIPHILILSGVLVLSLVGIILCVKFERKKNPYAKLMSLILTLNIIIASVVMFVKYTEFRKSIDDIRKHENQFVEASAVMLGEIFAKKYPYSDALIIVRKGFAKHKRKDVLINALKKGFGDKIRIKAIEQIDKNMPDNASDRDIVSAKNFDILFEKYKDCEVVISTIGLPLDVENMKVWNRMSEDIPKIGLLNVYVKVLRNVIRAKYVAAAVIPRPDVKTSPNKEKNLSEKGIKEKFKLRYAMITPDNIDNFDNKYPKLFY